MFGEHVRVPDARLLAAMQIAIIIPYAIVQDIGFPDKNEATF